MSTQGLIKRLLNYALKEADDDGSFPEIVWFGEFPENETDNRFETADRIEGAGRLIHGVECPTILEEILKRKPKTNTVLEGFRNSFPAIIAWEEGGFSGVFNLESDQVSAKRYAAANAMPAQPEIPVGLKCALQGEGQESLVATKVLKQTAQELSRELRDQDVRIFDTGRRRKKEERLILVRTRNPDAAVYEALQSKYFSFCKSNDGEKKPEPLDILILHQKEGKSDDPWRIDIHAAAKWRHVLHQAMRKGSRREHDLLRTRAWLKGRSELHLRVQSMDGKASSALSEFVNFLLREMVVGARPLLAWRASFLQPLRVECESLEHNCLADTPEKLMMLREDLVKGGKWRPDGLTEEAQAYLIPHVREQLKNLGGSAEPLSKTEAPGLCCKKECAHESGVEPSRKTETPDDKQIPLTLSWQPENLKLCIQPGVEGKERYEKPLELAISKLRLHFFEFDAFAVEWELEQKNPNTRFKSWRDCFSARSSGLCLAQVMDVMAKGRYIFSTANAKEEGAQEIKTTITLKDGNIEVGSLMHLGEVTEGLDKPATWFGKLIEKYCLEDLSDGLNINAIRIVGDDRSRVFGSIIMAGDQPCEGDGVRPLLDRLRMMDEWGPGWFYDQAFAAGQLDHGYYSRFADFGSHYVVSDHAFCFLGFGDYPLKTIHKNHMANIYRPIFWLFPLWSAMADSFSRRVGRALDHIHKNDVSEGFASLKEKLTIFRNNLLFSRVSSQVQGRELFDLMRKASPVPDELESLEEQVGRIGDYYGALQDRRAENRVRFLTSAGVLFSLFFVGIGLLELVPTPLFWHFGVYFKPWHVSAVFALMVWGGLWWVGVLKQPKSLARDGLGKKRVRTILYWLAPVSMVLAVLVDLWMDLGPG